MGKKHKKPTGELGSVIFGGGQPAQFRTIEFPSSKENIEKMIVQADIEQVLNEKKPFILH
jgi:hypothetical protein